jgi:hypothetical protein
VENFPGTPQMIRQADFGERPDYPLRRVELPWLYAIAIVVLKLVVIVVIAFAKRHERRQPGIPGAAF